MPPCPTVVTPLLIHVGFWCVDTFLIQLFLFLGGADHIMRLWELDNSLCVQEYSGLGACGERCDGDQYMRVPICL